MPREKPEPRSSLVLSVYRRHALFARVTASRRSPPRALPVASRGPEIKYSLENEARERDREKERESHVFPSWRVCIGPLDSSIGPRTAIAELSARKKPMKRRANGGSYSTWHPEGCLPEEDTQEVAVCNKRLRPSYSFFLLTIFVMNVSYTVISNDQNMVIQRFFKFLYIKF